MPYADAAFRFAFPTRHSAAKDVQSQAASGKYLCSPFGARAGLAIQHVMLRIRQRNIGVPIETGKRQMNGTVQVAFLELIDFAHVDEQVLIQLTCPPEIDFREFRRLAGKLDAVSGQAASRAFAALSQF